MRCQADDVGVPCVSNTTVVAHGRETPRLPFLHLFMDKVMKHIQEILTSLDEENLKKVQQCLTDAGVETEDDLHNVQEYDLMPVWKKSE